MPQATLSLDQGSLTLTTLRKLLRVWHPLDINKTSASGDTLVIALVSSGLPPAVALSCVRELVLKHGADPTIGNDLGMAAVMYAAALGDARVVAFLAAHGADLAARGAHPNGFLGAPSPRPGKCRRTAREWAELYGHVAAVIGEAHPTMFSANS